MIIENQRLSEEENNKVIEELYKKYPDIIINPIEWKKIREQQLKW